MKSEEYVKLGEIIARGISEGIKQGGNTMAEPLKADRCNYEETYYYPDGSVKVVKYSEEETKGTEQGYDSTFYCEGEPSLQMTRHIRPCSVCGKLIDATDRPACDSCKEEEAPLLVIEVKDLNSLPVVKYRGEEITGKIAVEYRWGTKTDENGKHEYELEYAVKQEDKIPVIKKVSEKLFG